MADEKLTPAEAETALWEHLKGTNVTVMLGLNSPDQHSQPMTAFAEPENNQVWFFTRDDVDLVKDAAGSADARLVFTSKDEEIFADIRGALVARHDRARIDKYWGPVVAAWYPEGKADPHLMLLRFTPAEGQVWVAKAGLVKFAFEVAKANLTKTQPDAGGSAEVKF
jgi:general stress protein 26